MSRKPAELKGPKIRKEHIIQKLEYYFPDASKRQRTKMVNAVCEIITHFLGTGVSLMITNLGSLTVQYCAGKKGRNPRTNEPHDIAPYRRVYFNMAPSLKKKLNEPWVAGYFKRAEQEIKKRKSNAVKRKPN